MTVISNISLACIVEGHGEVEAVRILLRRIGQLVDPSLNVIPAGRPIRVPRSRLLKQTELERYVQLAAMQSKGILILIDADKDCPKALGPELLGRACSARPDRHIGVVLAKCEFEAWFLAAAISLRGTGGLNQDFSPPPTPEAIRGAKEQLQMNMARSYSEVLDQPRFTAKFDLDAARAAPSFDKCCREIRRLIELLRAA
jgi:hypothetical protein